MPVTKANLKSKEHVEQLEKLIGQLEGLHSEISQLARKSPNDGLNVFKLRLVNKVLSIAGEVLPATYIPFTDFTAFDEAALPSNSDVTMILAQYMQEAERFRSANVAFEKGAWRYVIGSTPSDVKSSPPTKVGANSK